MELNKENTKKIVGIVAFAIILGFALQNLGTIVNIFSKFIDVMSPFLVGAAIAFVLNIPMKMFERNLFKDKKTRNGKIKKSRLKRPVSILLAIIFIVLIITLVIKLVIPQLLSVLIMFIKSLPAFLYDIKEWALNLTAQYPDISNQIQGIEVNWEKLTNDIINFTTNFATNLISSSIGVVSSLINGIFNFIISIVFAFYILISKEKLKRQAVDVISAYFNEKKAKYIFEISELSKSTFSNFITGQCTEAVVIGTLCFIGMLILRLPFAATISVLVGVTALIPIIGAFLGAIIGAILILSISPIQSVIFIIYLVILQQIESNVIYPKVVGNSMGLPGMWVLMAVVVGGSLGGMLGLLLGLPIVSVLYTILKNDVKKRKGVKQEIAGEII